MVLRVLSVWIAVCGVSIAADDGSNIRVAVFRDEGVGASVESLVQAMVNADAHLEVTRLSAAQILSGDLEGVDVLVHPGGSGSKQGKALGPEGRKKVRQFVHDGGGYLGVCAGAYLATNDYSWSLDLIDAKVVDRRHWARGKGMVELRLSSAGAKFFAHPGGEMEIYYGQGPLLGRREWDDPEVPDYESLAIYDSEVAKNGAPKGIMAGTSAAVRTTFGQGRVFCFSPHPELTEGKEMMIVSAVSWLAGSKNEAPRESRVE